MTTVFDLGIFPTNAHLLSEKAEIVQVSDIKTPVHDPVVKNINERPMKMFRKQLLQGILSISHIAYIHFLLNNGEKKTICGCFMFSLGLGLALITIN